MRLLEYLRGFWLVWKIKRLRDGETLHLKPKVYRINCGVVMPRLKHAASVIGAPGFKTIIAGPLLLWMTLCLSLGQALYAQSQTNPIVATKRALVLWDANTETNLAGYNVYVSGPTNKMVTVATNLIVLTNVVWNWPNGVYALSVTAFNLSEIESDPSTNVWFFWYGNPPNKPKNIGFQFLPPAPK